MRVSDAVGIFPIVFILPEDVNLTTGSPKYHRNFLDIYLSQFSYKYLRNLIDYQKALKQRNALLKRIKDGEKIDEKMLDIWDLNVLKPAMFIMKSRAEFINEIKKPVKELMMSLSADCENVEISYMPSLDVSAFDDEAIISAAFRENRGRDLRLGTTVYGPHRDLIDLQLDNSPLREFGSLGQKKSVMIAMKLAVFEVLSARRNEKAILVLDEAFAEFDRYRSGHLLSLLSGKGQVFLASANSEGIDLKENMKIFDVNSGIIKER